MTTTQTIPACLCCVLALSACTTLQQSTPTTNLTPSIANYKDTMTCMTPEFRLAPTLCRSPLPASGARMSQADPQSPHGQKLYHLYVSDPASYAAAVAAQAPAPTGLTIIKENRYSFLPEQEGQATSIDPSQPAWVPGPVIELFFMSKVSQSATPDTDAGWVYGVANPSGEIQTLGRIDSCIKCHENADNDRLFGLAPATTIYFN